MGVSVSYLDGKITNVGSKTVTGATVEVVFRNSLGEIVQRETLPLMLYHTGLAGFPDVAPLSAAPLMPNQTRDFRLTFEHISADWDQGYPELRFVRHHDPDNGESVVVPGARLGQSAVVRGRLGRAAEESAFRIHAARFPAPPGRVRTAGDDAGRGRALACPEAATNRR